MGLIGDMSRGAHNQVWQRGLTYTATAAGIAIAISCNYVLLMIVGAEGGLASVSGLRPLATVEILLATILMVIIIGPVLELASLYPGSSGIRTYTNKGIGQDLSIIVTFAYMLVLIFIASVESFLLLSILSTFIIKELAIVIVSFLLLAIVGVNYRGVILSDKVQRWSTTILWFGSMLICWSAYVFSANSSVESVADINVEVGLLENEAKRWFQNFRIEGVALGIFLFIGVELAASSARNPDDLVKVLPRAVFVAIGLIGALYASMAWVLLSLSPKSVESGNPLLFFGDFILSDSGRLIALLLTMQALLTSFNSGLKGLSRMLFFLSRERVVSSALSRLADDGSTPVMAVLCVSIVSLTTCIFTNSFSVSLEVSSLSATLICLVYAALLVSSIRCAERKQLVKSYYNCRLPKAIRYLLATVFIMLGLSNLMSLFQTEAGVFIASIALIVLSSLWWRARGASLLLTRA